LYQLVRAAKIQADGQMQEAWTQPVHCGDAKMNPRVRYPRDEIDQGPRRLPHRDAGRSARRAREEGGASADC
jgi:hypothetical protein